MTALEQTQTRPIRLHRAALVALAAVLWALGWLAGTVCRAAVWAFLALKVGWMDARVSPRRR